ncbi:MAG: hypothetical protein IJ737_02980 [Ruminococcus sp.]|nr:hypothetical protein [Ruminococcus sp.]
MKQQSRVWNVLRIVFGVLTAIMAYSASRSYSLKSQAESKTALWLEYNGTTYTKSGLIEKFDSEMKGEIIAAVIFGCLTALFWFLDKRQQDKRKSEAIANSAAVQTLQQNIYIQNNIPQGFVPQQPGAQAPNAQVSPGIQDQPVQLDPSLQDPPQNYYDQ